MLKHSESFNMKFLLVTGIFLISSSVLNAQTMEYWGDGQYELNTNFPNSDLHFYLFDDGYHSFNKNVFHASKDESLPVTPILYHSEPYVYIDPAETSFQGVNEGSVSTIPEVLNFANQIEVKLSWNLVSQEENFFILMFENSISTDTISGCVEFHFNKTDLEIEDEDILDNYGNDWVENRTLIPSEYNNYEYKYKWEFNRLAPGEQRFVYIPARCLLTIFEIVNTRGVLKIDDCDVTIPEDAKTDGSSDDVNDSKIYSLESVVSSVPHDPNYMITDPTCLDPQWGAQSVIYKIQFQNDGIDPVQDVFIEIMTNGDFNYDNVTLTNSSDICEMIWEENSLHITFPNIYLAGMKQQPEPNSLEETIGWVELEVCYNITTYTIEQVRCVNAEGRIVFDNQPPIPISNSLCTSVDCAPNVEIIGADCPHSDIHQSSPIVGSKALTTIHDIEGLEFDIIKNISNDFLTLNGLDDNLNSKCAITNATGEIVQNLFLENSNVIDISSFPKGIYYITIYNDYRIQTKRFVKI